MTTGKAVREQPSVDVWKKIGPFVWISLGLLVFGLALFAVYIWKAEKLVALGLAGYVYYLVLVLFAVAVAVILFGALRSYADYSGRQFGGVLKMSGPIVGVLVLVVLGFWLPPPSSNFPLTAYVHGPGGKQDLILRGNGYVRIDIGGLPRKASIGNDGEAFFPEIPANFRGQEVNISLDAAGYELANPDQKARLDASSIYLEVRKKSGRITGRVHDEVGASLGGARITVAGMTVTTDASGYFEVVIPGEKLQPSMPLQAAASGYISVTETAVPNSNEMVITLQRQR